MTPWQQELCSSNLSNSCHCVTNLHSEFFGRYFPAFGLNTERYSASIRIQSEYGKIRTRKTPDTDTFDAVCLLWRWNKWHLTLTYLTLNKSFVSIINKRYAPQFWTNFACFDFLVHLPPSFLYVFSMLLT